MTNPAIIEALTAKMEEIWNDDLSFADQAAAVLELVGPKPLVWMRNGSHWAGGLGWVVRKMGSQYVLTKASRFDQNFDTLEAAQAAAQAHADAAHWANTNIGGE